jgi:hypothetical protein
MPQKTTLGFTSLATVESFVILQLSTIDGAYFIHLWFHVPFVFIIVVIKYCNNLIGFVSRCNGIEID